MKEYLTRRHKYSLKKSLKFFFLNLIIFSKSTKKESNLPVNLKQVYLLGFY